MMRDLDEGAGKRIEWAQSSAPVDYEAAVRAMEERVALIAAGNAPELVWLLEHPPIYTAGTSAKPGDLVTPARFPVYATGRGGELTYHGPGQRVAYVMLDVRRRFRADVRAFVAALQDWIIDALDRVGIGGGTRPGRVGIWVERTGTGKGGEAKIAALGIRVRGGVSFHGISINVAPELEHFSGIVPCGIRDYGVTSLAELGSRATMKDVDKALKAAFEVRFALARSVPDPFGQKSADYSGPTTKAIVRDT